MRSALCLTLVAYQFSAAVAHAGPWLREEGTSFLSTSFSATYFYDLTQSTYIEYGLQENLTLGFDLNTGQSRIGLQNGSATVFLRFPLGEPTERGRWAYDLGAGASWTDVLISPHLRAGLSWGRGFTFGERNGWLTVDASAKWEFGFSQEVIKLDTTAGFDFTEVVTGMTQVFVTYTGGETYAKFAPSIVLSPSFSKFRVQLGSEVPFDAPENSALTVSLWREF
ncbi:MAG: hypothetical protein ABJN05_17660 [Sulfitobacter dubius]